MPMKMRVHDAELVEQRLATKNRGGIYPLARILGECLIGTLLY